MAGNQNPFAAIFGDDPFGVGGGFSGGGSRQGAPQVEFNTNEEFNKMKDKFATMGKKAMIACAIIAVIVVAVAYWWFHPPSTSTRWTRGCSSAFSFCCRRFCSSAPARTRTSWIGESGRL